MHRFEPDAHFSAHELVRLYGKQASAFIDNRIEACIAANDHESALNLDRLRRQVTAMAAA